MSSLAKSFRYRPLDKELTPDTDTPARAASRARAERILAQTVASISQEEVIDNPVMLALFDQTDDQVSIGCYRRRHVSSERTRLMYVVSAGTYWIDTATDGQLRAVFAHELGHAVSGHCEDIEDWELEDNLEHFRRRTRFMLGMCFLFFCFCVGSLSTAGKGQEMMHAWFEALATIQAVVVISFLGWYGFQDMCNAYWDRRDEYEADTFCVRFADPRDMISDLERSCQTRLDHFQEWLMWPFFTHPPLRARARAMGVPFDHYRKLGETRQAVATR